MVQKSPQQLAQPQSPSSPRSSMNPLMVDPDPATPGTATTSPNNKSRKKKKSPKNNTANSNSGWWQKSVARRTARFVASDLETVMQQSPFLQQAQQQQAAQSTAQSTIPDANYENEIGLFHRSEIQTGKLLGVGGFSQVLEVTGFCLDEAVSVTLTPHQQAVRQYYASHVYHNDDSSCPRFALKHLQRKLLKRPKEFACAASDLCVEAAYLSALDHDHILQMRGLPVHGLQALDESYDGYFLLTDKLEKTLEQVMQEDWQHADASQVLGQKLHVAHQLATALQHLHEHRIVFRDLKPQNIGMTKTGCIQLFDFGLCRELPAATTRGAAVRNEVYEMSGVGTRRYMAVEIIQTARYNCKADVYSWSMILWEMLQLERPYAVYSVEDHCINVCEGGERPPLDASWSWSLQNLLRQSWLESVPQRLSMSEVCFLLKAMLQAHQNKNAIATVTPVTVVPVPTTPTAVPPTPVSRPTTPTVSARLAASFPTTVTKKKPKAHSPRTTSKKTMTPVTSTTPSLYEAVQYGKKQQHSPPLAEVILMPINSSNDVSLCSLPRFSKDSEAAAPDEASDILSTKEDLSAHAHMRVQQQLALLGPCTTDDSDEDSRMGMEIHTDPLLLGATTTATATPTAACPDRMLLLRQ